MMQIAPEFTGEAKREKCLAAQRARRTGNEHVKAWKRADYALHRDEILAKYKAKYAANPQKFLDRQKQLYDAHPGRRRKYALKEYYGMTLAQFDAIRDAQGGVCAVCQEPFIKIPHVDHCHATGTVRGLLCIGCNTGLGQFKDDPERMEAAASYIRKHRMAKLSIARDA